MPGSGSPGSQSGAGLVTHQTNAHEAAIHRQASYSINGILGIQAPVSHTDPNGNINKRKRDDIGEFTLKFLILKI